MFEDGEMKNINNRIRIAIQKSGRLSEESFRLLTSCGIYVKPRKEQLFCHSDNFPLDLLLVRDNDIPNLVSEGTCDFGIVGTNVLQEQSLQNGNTDPNNKNEIIRYLGFALCRLSIAVPKSFAYQDLTSLKKCRIATSYPQILSDFIQKNNLDMDITTLTGSVEIAPRLGIADGICDLVSTGATLEANNLQEVETVFKSQAVLIKTTKTFSEEKQQTAKLFQNRVEGSELANGSKYIMLHAPKSALSAIVTLLPGAERPTVLELQGDTQKVAIHALCRESIFWETMEKLKMAGASSILVLPIEKMMT
jgi:ATP phosphoribosyltransferase